MMLFWWSGAIWDKSEWVVVVVVVVVCMPSSVRYQWWKWGLVGEGNEKIGKHSSSFTRRRWWRYYGEREKVVRIQREFFHSPHFCFYFVLSWVFLSQRDREDTESEVKWGTMYTQRKDVCCCWTKSPCCFDLIVAVSPASQLVVCNVNAWNDLSWWWCSVRIHFLELVLLLLALEPASHHIPFKSSMGASISHLRRGRRAQSISPRHEMKPGWWLRLLHHLKIPKQFVFRESLCLAGYLCFSCNQPFFQLRIWWGWMPTLCVPLPEWTCWFKSLLSEHCVHSSLSCR